MGEAVLSPCWWTRGEIDGDETLDQSVDPRVDRPARSILSNISKTDANRRPDIRIIASSSEDSDHFRPLRVVETHLTAHIAVSRCWKDRVDELRRACRIFIQNSAWALIDWHITALAHRPRSSSS